MINTDSLFNNSSKNEPKMPVLFIGHGSPMNAIEDNDFTRTLNLLGKTLNKPKAILCISAHWLTKGTAVNVSPYPKMIYDMYGFPKELYAVDYPAKGSPETADWVRTHVTQTAVIADTGWGFDHGAWSVVKHLYPAADVPLLEMSIDYNQPMQYHYNLAKQLAQLRNRGVLIVGSGNITHNLGRIDFPDIESPVRDWALEFDSKIKNFMDDRNHQGVINYMKIGAAAKLSVPEPSHFIPLIYAIALQNEGEEISYFYDRFHFGSLSMRCLKIGD